MIYEMFIQDMHHLSLVFINGILICTYYFCQVKTGKFIIVVVTWFESLLCVFLYTKPVCLFACSIVNVDAYGVQ